MLHIIQNDPEVPPGNLSEIFSVSSVVHYPYRGDSLPGLMDISALIVLGGAMGANDDSRYPFLGDLKNHIRSCVESGIPYLGICLGGQLLAAALGGAVVAHRWEELGTLAVRLNGAGINDPLFNGIPNEFLTFQWHHDSFDIPADGILLASSAVCPHQAFRVGTCAWGIQFHPEVTETIIRDWCARDCDTSVRTEELVSDFARQAEDYLRIARQIVTNFMRSAQLF